MGMLERACHLEKEVEAFLHGAQLFVAVAVDRAAVYLLHDEIGPSVRTPPTVEEAGDVGVRE